MELPDNLLAGITAAVSHLPHNMLMADARTISERYRANTDGGAPLIATKNESAAYLASRMPATYMAVYTALQNSIVAADIPVRSLLDAGAGTGAASWAASVLFPLTKIDCLEQEQTMIDTGKAMMAYGSEPLKSAQWHQCDLISFSPERFQADLVLASYVFNELRRDDYEKVVTALWKTAKTFVIIEPGTPAGWRNLMVLRKLLLEKGGQLLAPCCSNLQCPLPENDWCHCTCRVPSCKLHRLMKSGDAPYEDEKFSYIAFTKEPIMQASQEGGRVMRHPQIRKGFVTLTLCTGQGIKEITVTKSQKEGYKKARKVKAGHFWAL